MPSETSSRCRMKIGELVPVDVKLLLPPPLTNRPCCEFLPHKLTLATTQQLELTCSFFILHILRCFEELEPWRTPNTSRPIKKVGVELVQCIGGGGWLFLPSFFNCMQESLCFSGSSVPVSLFLIIQGETSKVGHMVTKRQNWGILHFYDAQNDPNCCSFKDQKVNWGIWVQIWPKTKFWLWANKC